MTLEVTQFAGPDGMVHLAVPVAEPNRSYRLVISAEPTTALESVERDERGWPKGFFDLAGTWQGEFPQDYEGDFEQRLEL